MANRCSWAAAALGLIALAALAVRLPRLDARPMHCDEAVHAVKLDELIRGEYRYDPTEYHGPSLYYFTLPVAWARGEHTLTDLRETTLRLVPVLFGVALILLLPLVSDGLGRRAVPAAGALLALSPAMVFYSRYYIQEMLLVFFAALALAAGWRYVRRPSAGWAALAGAGIGLMFATKETCVLSWFAAGLAALAAGGWGGFRFQVSVFRRTSGAEPPDGTEHETRLPQSSSSSSSSSFSIPPIEDDDEDEDECGKVSQSRAGRRTARGTRLPGMAEQQEVKEGFGFQVTGRTSLCARLFPFLKPETRNLTPRSGLRVSVWHWPYWALAAGTALVVAAALLTGFFTQPAGLLHSLDAFTHYAGRATGQGHEKPWYYYLQLLVGGRSGGFVWTEAFIVALALVGAARAFASRARPLLRFLAVYAAVLLALYSIIPYKTPWLVLGVLHPAILLAGAGAGALWNGCRPPAARLALALALAAGAAHLGLQTWRGSFRFCADERNPYVYSQTSPDAVRLCTRIHELARLHPDGLAMVVKVVSPEYWPLPWYLRDLPNVGYWAEPPDDPQAAVVVTTPEFSAAVEARLAGDYQAQLSGLRPGFNLCLLVRRDLWDAWLAAQAGGGAP